MKVRRPRRRLLFTTPFAAARNTALRAVSRYFHWLRPTTRFLLGFGVLTLISTLLLGGTYSQLPSETYEEGEVVRGNIISPADITVEDVSETQRRRDAVASATRPIWSYDPTRGESAVENFRSSWNVLRQEVEARKNGSAEREPTWPGAGGETIARAIIAHRFDERALENLTRILREAGDGYIYDDRDAPYLKQEIRLVNARDGVTSEIKTSQSRVMSLSEARQNLARRLSQLSDWTPEERKALTSALLPVLAPTIIFDQAATEAARNATGKAVPPVTISLKRNQVVAREGDTVSAQMLAQFAAINENTGTKYKPQHFIGLFFIVSALYWAAWKFTEHRSTTSGLPLSKGRAFTLVGSAIIVQLILMRIGFIVAHSIAAQSMYPPLNDPLVWGFAVPFAAAALLLALLVDTQLALITGIITALFAGLIAPQGLLMTSYAMVSSSAAIYGIGRYRERQSVTLAGLFVGAFNALMALAVILTAQQSLTLNGALLAVACGVAGGLLTTIFTAGGLPINESMFGILTDVKLLELSNADLPVLGQLALRAPGTNQHSHAVGQLAEDACRAIGANPLLARIGALYHDIGKLGAPDMFIENQTGVNPHDRIRPTNSARIITSHVTYGLKLAEEINLPKQIADFIPQHHGTRTLHFFLRKAQAQAAEGEVVDEAEFRYPGPKPQFRETAIMMLADSCEAAARSLARPDPENIRAIVSKIFDSILSDGQLDECDLTLREVTAIRESIVTSLTAIYHARIDYPGFNPPSLNPALPPLPPADLDTEERGVSYSKVSEVPISKGGEIEDEAVTSKGKK